MGSVIGKNANVGRIHEFVRETAARATARGGAVAAKAADLLADPVQTMASAKSGLDVAVETDRTVGAQLVAAEKSADIAAGSVRDEMWNLLLRTRDSTTLEAVFPGGVLEYTTVAREAKPTLLAELRGRIGAMPPTAGPWPEVTRTEWADRIEAAGTALSSALDSERDARVGLRVAEATYRAVVRMGWLAVVAFKRALKSLGMSEALIHEIIPSVERRRGSASGAANGGHDPGVSAPPVSG